MTKTLLVLNIIFLLAACNNNKAPVKANIKPILVTYPITKKDTTVKDNYFGTEVADPYRWLENDTSSQTKAWVTAENEVTQNYLKQILI